MMEMIISYICFSAITLYTLFWGLTFIAQVKNNQEPKFKLPNLNPVQKFEQKKKIAVDKEQLLHNG